MEVLQPRLSSDTSTLAQPCRSHAACCAVPCRATVCRAGRATWAIKSKLAVLLASVVRQRGVSAYTQLMPQLLGNADGNTLQVKYLPLPPTPIGVSLAGDEWCVQTRFFVSECPINPIGFSFHAFSLSGRAGLPRVELPVRGPHAV